MMSHERLDVYQCAVQYLALNRRIVHAFPRGYSDLVDQSMRAARSVVLNIAEGAGKMTAANRARYFADARGSAMECAACLDVAQIEQIITAEVLVEAKTLLERIISMLTRLCQARACPGPLPQP